MEFSWIDLLFLINLFCVWFSWNVANQCFERGDKAMGYFNIFASALNGVIFFNHFVGAVV